MADNPLNKKSDYPKGYSPDVLFGISRLDSRSSLNLDSSLNVKGIDHWRAYEISWINDSGKTEVRVGEFFFAINSKNIIESKSLKLYLNSFNGENFRDEGDVKRKIIDDLSNLSGSKVDVAFYKLDSAINLNIMIRNGRSIDAEKISKAHKDPDSVAINTSDIIVEGEKLHSDLFRSVCPITGQPDWASFQVEYSGKQICASDLLTYLCSYRDHPGYHEECTERVFHDIYRRCEPSSLSISLNFLRRGGIDINIYRSTNELTAEEIMTRLVRQ